MCVCVVRIFGGLCVICVGFCGVCFSVCVLCVWCVCECVLRGVFE